MQRIVAAMIEERRGEEKKGGGVGDKVSAVSCGL